MSKTLTPEDIRRIQQLRDQGMLLKDIAKVTGFAYNTVCKFAGSKVCDEDPNWRNKRNWPEWEQWRNLHKRYGKCTVGGNR